MRRYWRPLKNGAIYVVVVAAIAALRCLPIALLARLGRPLGLLACLIAGPERRRAARNLAHVRLLSGRRPGPFVRQVFVHMGRSAIECVAMGRANSTWPQVGFAPGAREVLVSALSAGRGVVFVSAHLGNWELMAMLLARLGELHVLARQSYDSRLTKLMDGYRRAQGVDTIWVERSSALRLALRALTDGAMVGLLVDQPVRRGAWAVPFLGRPAPTSTLAAGLARSTGARLLVGHTLRLANGKHEVWIDQIDTSRGSRSDDLLLWTRHVNQRLERAIYRAPTQWLWSLDRWRGMSDTETTCKLHTTGKVEDFTTS